MKNIRWLSFFLTGFGFQILFGALVLSPTINFAQSNRLKTVVIDAGHGGKDPGCLGKVSREKNVALSVALQLGEMITQLQPDVKVIYTRKTDVFIELDERTRIANKAGADLFISIHCNASLKKGISGTETYIMGLHVSQQNLLVAMRENSVMMKEANYQSKYKGFNPNSPASYILMSNQQSAHQGNSLNLASKIEHHFTGKVAHESRGVKQSGFWVLAQTGMPSVLVEIGFLTTQKEELYLNTELGQASIATSLYKAFRDYKKELEKG
jgi:N-acetylmuramoyl-L-alanine amidase